MNVATVDLDKICRSCLTQDNELTSIFHTMNSEHIKVSDMMASCTFLLDMGEHDGLPSQICLQCYNAINQAYNFKQQCEKSDNVLKNLLKEHLQNVKVVKIENMLEENDEPDNNSKYSDELTADEEYLPMEDVAMIEEVDIAENNTIVEAVDFDERINMVYECGDCYITFQNANELNDHALICHDNEQGDAKESTFSCSNCGKKFKNIDVLRNHIRICEIHECHHCNKQFKSIGYLNVSLSLYFLEIVLIGAFFLEPLKKTRPRIRA